jgi:hypothetical protein
MQQDMHSAAVPTCRMIVTPGEATFTAMDVNSGWSLPCPPIEGVVKDYFGNTMDEQAYAGPLGKIEAGINRWILWPIR